MKISVSLTAVTKLLLVWVTVAPHVNVIENTTQFVELTEELMIMIALLAVLLKINSVMVNVAI
jgi:hypothetical protein